MGWRQPIVIDEDGVVIVGHGRLRAAVQLGLDEVPVHVARGLAPEKVRALRLADNRVGELSSWDDASLMSELGLVREAGDPGLEALGFGADFLDKLGAGFIPEPSDKLPTETDIQPGDVLEIGGGSRLACGSSSDETVRALALGGGAPYLMVTDPPYGVDYDPNWRARQGVHRKHYQAPDLGFDDSGSIGSYVSAALLPSIDVAYVWHASSTKVEIHRTFEAVGFEMRAELVWVKPGFQLSRGHFSWAHESCLYAVRKGRQSRWNSAKKASTVMRPDWLDETVLAVLEAMVSSGHPTQKPVECMARPIRYSSEPGAAVWEPFAGSGTTIMAAEREGRVACAVEIQPVFCELARRRAIEAGMSVRRVESSG